MSTNFFPLGMQSYGNTTTAPFTNQGTITKGFGPYAYPIATTSGNVRPLTNKDPRNNAPQKFGLPRPLKWNYRYGTTFSKNTSNLPPNSPYLYENTSVASNTSKIHLVSLTIDKPGRYSVKHNPKDEKSSIVQLTKDCEKCHGVGLVASFAPERYLTNNPQPCVTNPKLCCNQEQKALQAVIYANTNLKPNYYNTHYQYLQNRCQTYQQKSFNFTSPQIDYSRENANKNLLAKPGSPQALSNTYIANCFPNIDQVTYSQVNIVYKAFLLLKSRNLLTANDIEQFNQETIDTISKMYQFISTIEGNKEEAYIVYNNLVNNPYVGVPINGPSNPKGCKLVIYKPSNYQFAYEGGVSASTRLLKLTVDTISKNITNTRRLSGANPGGQPYNPFIYKNKYTKCPNSNTFFMRPFGGSKKVCRYANSEEFVRTKAFDRLGNKGGDVQGTFVAEVGMTNSMN
jgi:hypothetical protein